MAVKASSPADLIAYIPHGLGYEPKNAMVFLMFNRRKGLGATLRFDLPDRNAADDAVHEWAEHVAHTCRLDTEAEAAMLAVYAEDDWVGRPLPHHVDALNMHLMLEGIDLLGAVLVASTHYRCATCDDCGISMPQSLDDVRDSRLNAEMILMGSNPERGEPALNVPPASDEYLDMIRELVVSVGSTFGDPMDFHTRSMVTARRTLRTLLERPHAVTDDALRLIACLQFTGLRDRLMADIIAPRVEDAAGYGGVLIGRVEGEVNWERVQAADDLLVYLLGIAPQVYRAPLMTVLGWLHWLRGSGSKADLWLNGALEADPRYNLARLLQKLMHIGTVADIAQDPVRAYRKRAVSAE